MNSLQGSTTLSNCIMLIQALQARFEQAQNPQNAIKQAQYMRHQFRFLGLKAGSRKEVQKVIFAQYPLSDQESLQKKIHTLWNLPYREYQYAALDLAQKYSAKLTAMAFIRSLIVQKSWWDTVDCLAGNIISQLLLKKPTLLAILDQWIADPNLWLRRSALIGQLRCKDKTDAARLFHYCLATAHEKDFFIQKAIGWSLRQYARVNPKSVYAFVKANEYSLSALSLREACKHHRHWLEGR